MTRNPAAGRIASNVSCSAVGTACSHSHLLSLQVRVFELSQLSLKFERHFDAEIVEYQARAAAHLPLHLPRCFVQCIAVLAEAASQLSN